MFQIPAWAKAAATYLARYADFDRFFDTVVRAKAVKGVFNNGSALAVMVELANERLNQRELG